MVIILLANGFEEIEALTPVDMLRRAGVEVRTVGVSGSVVTGSHGIPVVADLKPEEVDLDQVEMAVFPGGMPGATNLDASDFTDKVIEAVTKNGGRLAAICAAPLVLGRRGLLKGKCATCYPGFETELKGAACTGEEVVTDGRITTGRDMTAALAFANELVELMTVRAGENKEKDVPDTFKIGNLTFARVKEDEKTDGDSDECDAPESAGEVDCLLADTAESYELPSSDLLSTAVVSEDESLEREIKDTTRAILEVLSSFNVAASIKGVDVGPRVIRYEIVPAAGTLVAHITRLMSDIMLALDMESARMQAPIPGRSSIGLEVPRRNPGIVTLKELIDTEEFRANPSPTAFCVGKGVSGEPVFDDIAKLPHAIVAGATGMGKSVCLNSMIASMLYKATPEQLRLILIDPKKVEFCAFDGIPHLLMPVITDAKKAAGALMWAIEEMERRYDLLERLELRNIDAYNKAVAGNPAIGAPAPKIVIVIDELCDLMMQLKDPVEDLIMRIAQKARAAGIHLIIGTQRPDTKVITGTVKANISTRIAFKLSSIQESRNVMDMAGAELLLNKGDMLYKNISSPDPIRVQGCFISDDELEAVCKHIKSSAAGVRYDKTAVTFVDAYSKAISVKAPSKKKAEPRDEMAEMVDDQLFLDAVDISIRSGLVSTSLLQRKLQIGFGKAARFIDIMEEMGIISEPNGQKPRDVLITHDEWREKLKRIGF